MSEPLVIRGFEIEKLGMEQALSRIKEMQGNSGMSFIVTANPEILEAANLDEELAEAIRGADMVVPDGIGLVYASRIKKNPLAERVTGIDLAYGTLEYLAKIGGSVYLLGAKPGVAEAAGKKLSEALPGLRIAGCRDGYFSKEAEAAVVAGINESRADFLCVALGAPKQELFLSKHKDELDVKVGIGIGGSLDVWSGNTKRAPEFWRKNGIEWLYRLLTEPSRIKRQIKLPMFLLRVLFDK